MSMHATIRTAKGDGTTRTRPPAPPSPLATRSPTAVRANLPDPTFRRGLLTEVPNLRSFALSLCGNMDRADDLVQETLLRAMANVASFEPGTNLPAWLFTILRNLFRSEFRKRRREVEDSEGRYEATLISAPEQEGRVALAEFRDALASVQVDQREALMLVGAAGFSYEEAAEICNIPVGTIKSRVHRARLQLSELLQP